MEELFADPDPARAERAMQAMLGMRKLDLAAMRARGRRRAHDLLGAIPQRLTETADAVSGPTSREDPLERERELIRGRDGRGRGRTLVVEGGHPHAEQAHRARADRRRAGAPRRRGRS
jgi:hypothetical protein